jgi:phosphotriesterase-related protein
MKKFRPLLCLALLTMGASAATQARTSERHLSVPPEWTMEGQIQTVQGGIAPEEAGFILPHEHLFTNFFEPAERLGYRLEGPVPLPAARFFQSFGMLNVPDTPEKLAFWDRADIDLSMIAKMREGAIKGDLDAFQNKNMALLDRDSDAIYEVNQFREFGGKTIVDVTVDGIGRSPKRLQRVSEVTGVNIVMGTGWYRWPFHPDWLKKKSVDDLAQMMINDIVFGVDGSSIKSGIIGEIPIDPYSVVVSGALLSSEELATRRRAQMQRANAADAALSDVIESDELKVLRAAARAARATGAALSLHYLTSSLQPLDIIEAEGLPLDRVIVGHADSLLKYHEGAARKMLARGVTLELDYGLQYTAVQGPVNEAQKQILDTAAKFILEGHEKQILLSHDMCGRLNLSRYGGSGLTWISTFVIPYLRRAGVNDAQIRSITVDNPKRLLTFARPMPTARRSR